MKVAEYVAGFLAERSVPLVFELPGGMITPILDALHVQGRVRTVVTYHEQAAAFAADAASRMLARPCAAIGTVGPGAMNLLSGIASSYFDSSPTLFLAGQVQTYLLRGERPVRQFGFQECDVASMASHITKETIRIRDPRTVAAALDRAYALAIHGRPGPVFVEFPMDVQSMPIEVDPRDSRTQAPAPSSAPLKPELTERAVDALIGAARPLLLVGGGVRSAGCVDALRRFAARTGVPVASSIMGLDALAFDDPLRVGMTGMYGNRWANLAMSESDCLLVLGCRLDPGVTSADATRWRKGKTIWRVDCDAGELATRSRDSNVVHADLTAFLPAALAVAEGRPPVPCDDWRRRVAELRARWPSEDELRGVPGINPNRFVQELSRRSRDAGAFVVDAGQHTWWVAQSLELGADQRFLVGSSFGAMGFALPAGIGAALACGRPVVVAVGDGAMQINIQELQTVAREGLPLKIVVFDNQCHGMVRQFQEGAFDRRYVSTVWGYSAPDFVSIARSYGIAAHEVDEAGDIDAALARLWERPDRPALLRVRIPTETNVYPIVPFGAPLTAMESLHPPRDGPGAA